MNLSNQLNAVNNMGTSWFSNNLLTNPSVMGGGQAFANSTKGLTNLAGTAGDVAGQALGGAGKFTKALESANKYVAPAQAVMGMVSLGMDIYNSVEAQNRAKEQIDLAKKNFNLELAKAQKEELANNQLAASIDKAWGGTGEISKTIDYSAFAPKDYTSGLTSGGAGGGYMGGGSASPSAEMGGSGNMPMGSANTASPVGYSDSIDTQNQSENENEEEAS